MGRRNSFKAFIPTNPPPDFLRPANGHAKMAEWKKPVISTDLTKEVDQAKKRLTITNDYTLSSEDHFVGVNSSGGPITLTLPSLASLNEGKIYIIKDEGDLAATNKITIATADNSTIDGASSIILDSNCASVSLYMNGTGWYIY